MRISNPTTRAVLIGLCGLPLSWRVQVLVLVAGILTLSGSHQRTSL